MYKAMAKYYAGIFLTNFIMLSIIFSLSFGISSPRKFAHPLHNNPMKRNTIYPYSDATAITFKSKKMRT